MEEMKDRNKMQTVCFALCPVVIFFLLKLFYASRAAAEVDMNPRYAYFCIYIVIGLLLFAEGYIVRQVQPKICLALSLFWILVIVGLLAGVLVFQIIPYNGFFMPVFLDISTLPLLGFYLGTTVVSAIHLKK